MKGDFTYPNRCNFNGMEWKIISIDCQGGFFDLQNPIMGMLEMVDIEECEPIETYVIKPPNPNPFKIVSRSVKTGSQYKKKVYISEASYLKYKDAIINRWGRFYHIFCYEYINNEWVQIYEKLCEK